MIALGIDPGITRENPVGAALVRWPLGEASPVLLGAATLRPVGSEPLALFLGRLGLRLRTDWLNNVELAGVEWPYIGENPQSALDLAACCGVVLGAAGEAGIRCLQVSPAQAKLALAGRGSATKQMMIDAAHQQFGRALVKDAADAVGIALAALVEARRAVQLPLPKRPVRTKTKKG